MAYSTVPLHKKEGGKLLKIHTVRRPIHTLQSFRGPAGARLSRRGSWLCRKAMAGGGSPAKAHAGRLGLAPRQCADYKTLWLDPPPQGTVKRRLRSLVHTAPFHGMAYIT